MAWCDLGGGLLWDRKEAYTLDLQQEAEAIQRAYQKHLGSCGLDQIGIHTQLGRFLAAPSGLLLTTVRGVKGDWVGGWMPPWQICPGLPWRGVQYHASLLGTDCLQGRSGCFLSGWSADSLDHFGAAASFPRSDLAMSSLIHGAGAYSRSMSSNYSGSLRCPEILLEQGVPPLDPSKRNIGGPSDRTSLEMRL